MMTNMPSIDNLINALEDMTSVVRHISGSFALRGAYGWDSNDQRDLDKAEWILEKALKARKKAT